jgi:hypothetical protein
LARRWTRRTSATYFERLRDQPAVLLRVRDVELLDGGL